MSAACQGRYALAWDASIKCYLKEGHGGKHFGSLLLNGVDCDTNWSDDNDRAYYDTDDCAKQSSPEKTSEASG